MPIIFVLHDTKLDQLSSLISTFFENTSFTPNLRRIANIDIPTDASACSGGRIFGLGILKIIGSSWIRLRVTFHTKPKASIIVGKRYDKKLLDELANSWHVIRWWKKPRVIKRYQIIQLKNKYSIDYCTRMQGRPHATKSIESIISVPGEGAHVATLIG